MKNLLQPDYLSEILVAITPEMELHVAIDYTKIEPLTACDVLIRAAGIIAAQHGKQLKLGG